MGAKRQLKSERVVVQAPMSFAGALGRVKRLYSALTRWTPNPVVGIPVRIIVWFALAALLVAWWLVIVVWYFVSYLLVGWLLFAFRLLRRSSRKRKAEKYRHRELLEAIDNKNREQSG